MGAWGAGAFEDDTALDWLDGPFAEDGAAAVASALDAVNNAGGADYLDADKGIEARAAAEAVAIAHGAMPGGLDAEIRSKVHAEAKAIKALDNPIKRANSAVARIWSDNSELNELWNEDGGGDWDAALRDLTARLSRAEREQP